jgi:hypothetical protein
MLSEGQHASTERGLRGPQHHVNNMEASPGHPKTLQDLALTLAVLNKFTHTTRPRLNVDGRDKGCSNVNSSSSMAVGTVVIYWYPNPMAVKACSYSLTMLPPIMSVLCQCSEAIPATQLNEPSLCLLPKHSSHSSLSTFSKHIQSSTSL